MKFYEPPGGVYGPRRFPPFQPIGRGGAYANHARTQLRTRTNITVEVVV